MKDPLQRDESPYEVLGLSRGATDVDVMRAFATRMKSGANPSALLQARTALQRRDERALCDLFQYDPVVLEQLQPNAQADPDALLNSHRGSTAAAWTRQLKSAVADTRTAHALALLWYWWAVSLSQEAANGQAGPAEDECWRRAIAFWVLAANGPEFRNGGLGIPADLAANVRSVVLNRLREKAREADQRLHLNGAQRLELALSTEESTAKQITEAGIRLGQSQIRGGRLLLETLGGLDTVRSFVDGRLKTNPTDARLLALKDALSQYSPIVVLIRNGQPKDALDALAKLPTAQRSSPEVKRLRVQAQLELGTELVSLDKHSDALATWAKALKEADPATASQIRDLVVEACDAKAAALQKTQPDEAISLLELGLTLATDDARLKARLADLVTQRGIDKCNAAQKRDNPEQVLAALREGRNDLKRAADLGSARAREQLKVVDEIIRTCEAELLAGRGVQKCNAATERLNRAGTAVSQQLLETVLAELRDGRNDLKRAVDLGSARAPQQLAVAENLIQTVEQALQRSRLPANSAPSFKSTEASRPGSKTLGAITGTGSGVLLAVLFLGWAWVAHVLFGVPFAYTFASVVAIPTVVVVLCSGLAFVGEFGALLLWVSFRLGALDDLSPVGPLRNLAFLFGFGGLMALARSIGVLDSVNNGVIVGSLVGLIWAFTLLRQMLKKIRELGWRGLVAITLATIVLSVSVATATWVIEQPAGWLLGSQGTDKPALRLTDVIFPDEQSIPVAVLLCVIAYGSVVGFASAAARRRDPS